MPGNADPGIQFSIDFVFEIVNIFLIFPENSDEHIFVINRYGP